MLRGMPVLGATHHPTRTNGGLARQHARAVLDAAIALFERPERESTAAPNPAFNGYATALRLGCPVPLERTGASSGVTARAIPATSRECGQVGSKEIMLFSP